MTLFHQTPGWLPFRLVYPVTFKNTLQFTLMLSVNVQKFDSYSFIPITYREKSVIEIMFCLFHPHFATLTVNIYQSVYDHMISVSISYRTSCDQTLDGFFVVLCSWGVPRKVFAIYRYVFGACFSLNAITFTDNVQVWHIHLLMSRAAAVSPQCSTTRKWKTTWGFAIALWLEITTGADCSET